MAWSFYGCGTCLVPSRSIVRWRKSWFAPPDYDGLECFCLFLMPIVPLRAVHAFDWSLASREWDWQTGQRDDTDYCRTLPIRWDIDLIGRAYVRRWSGAALWFGGMFAFGLLYGMLAGRIPVGQALGSFCCLFLTALAAAGALLMIWLTDQPRRNICRILGPAEDLGGDPATWTDERLDDFGAARQRFGTATFAEAVPRLLATREYAWAMLAARFSLVRDPAGTGAAITATELVLQSPEVRQALALVRANPTTWFREMHNGDAKSAR